ncbi:MAG: DNA polymerase III subunit delta [Ignavibacterium sp.]|nr:MAG: DNA polymerase III subunit delta [Ignavibacterium sp.]
MAKTRAPSILDVIDRTDKSSLLPVYYFFGDDYYLLQNALSAIETASAPLISSDFDRETFYGDDKSLSDVLDFASAFPFGSEKKLLIFKQFEKVRDKKPLKDYAKSPVDFTVLVIIHSGSITNLDSEPYKTLRAHNFIFEAKELRGKTLNKWLINHIEKKGKKISEETAQMLVDISGESRNMLQAQLEKIITFMNDEKEITLDHVQNLSTSLKQNSIFDLQNALGRKEKDKSIQIAYNLLDNGAEPVFIVAMLTRYFTGLSKINELNKMNLPLQQAARYAGTHHFYYKDYQQARTRYSDLDLANVFRALLKADLSIKTTSSDGKNVITILLSEILN